MIEVQIIASGSKGNCTALTANNSTVLLDVGINFSKLQRALNFENPTAVFLTHEHSDHVNKSTLTELLKRGVEVYMTEATAQALKLEPRHNLNDIALDADIGIGNFIISVCGAKHDAADPVNFFVVNEHRFSDTVAYITDTEEVPDFGTYELPRLLIIEANHDTETLLTADIDEHQKQRILHNHLSVEKVAKCIEEHRKEFLQEVHLIHISKRHGNAEKFRQIVQEIVGDNVKVFAY